MEVDDEMVAGPVSPGGADMNRNNNDPLSETGTI